MTQLRRTVLASLAGAAAGGGLDILSAFALWGPRGVPPERVLQSVASGALGPAAYQGGTGAAALGLALHFLISLGFAAAFVLAARRLPALLRRPAGVGLLYGLLAFVIMTYVLVPLSRSPVKAPAGDDLVIAVAVHMLLFGLPIALAARWLLGPPGAKRG